MIHCGPTTGLLKSKARPCLSASPTSLRGRVDVLDVGRRIGMLFRNRLLMDLSRLKVPKELKL
mgnify:CR=1 FL=1